MKSAVDIFTLNLIAPLVRGGGGVIVARVQQKINSRENQFS